MDGSESQLSSAFSESATLSAYDFDSEMSQNAALTPTTPSEMTHQSRQSHWCLVIGSTTILGTSLIVGYFFFGTPASSVSRNSLEVVDGSNSDNSLGIPAAFAAADGSGNNTDGVENAGRYPLSPEAKDATRTYRNENRHLNKKKRYNERHERETTNDDVTTEDDATDSDAKPVENAGDNKDDVAAKGKQRDYKYTSSSAAVTAVVTTTVKSTTKSNIMRRRRKVKKRFTSTDALRSTLTRASTRTSTRATTGTTATKTSTTTSTPTTTPIEAKVTPTAQGRRVRRKRVMRKKPKPAANRDAVPSLEERPNGTTVAISTLKVSSSWSSRGKLNSTSTAATRPMTSHSRTQAEVARPAFSMPVIVRRRSRHKHRISSPYHLRQVTMELTLPETVDQEE